jgi:hypothetical protein
MSEFLQGFRSGLVAFPTMDDFCFVANRSVNHWVNMNEKGIKPFNPRIS